MNSFPYIYSLKKKNRDAKKKPNFFCLFPFRSWQHSVLVAGRTVDKPVFHCFIRGSFRLRAFGFRLSAFGFRLSAFDYDYILRESDGRRLAGGARRRRKKNTTAVRAHGRERVNRVSPCTDQRESLEHISSTRVASEADEGVAFFF